MRICIDFDGVIRGKDDKPIEGAVSAMKDLWDNVYIIIFTVRVGEPSVIEWLEKYNIRFNELTNIKPDDIAFFIDDHALRFDGNWQKTLEDMNFYDKNYQLSKQMR